MVTISAQATASELLSAAVDKHCACNWNLVRSDVYKLLYPDGTVVDTLPGSKIAFTVEGYRKFMSKAYSKLTLFLCAEHDHSPGTTFRKTTCNNRCVTCSHITNLCLRGAFRSALILTR